MQVGYNFHDKNYPHNDQENINFDVKSTFFKIFFVVITLLPFTLGDHLVPAYGPPQVFCTETNNTIYAEVCVPAFTNHAAPGKYL